MGSRLPWVLPAYARMFADSSAHASSHGFQAAVGSSRVTRQSVSHQVCGRASPWRRCFLSTACGSCHPV